MKLTKLWRYHSVRAVGDEAIIAAANARIVDELAYALSQVANGYKPVTTIEEASEYFSNTESGCVSETSVMWVGDTPVEYDEYEEDTNESV